VEALAPLLAEAVRWTSATHLVAAASPLTRSTLPRVCALLDVMQLSEVVRIESPDTFVRPLYAGSALATVKSSDPVKIVTVRISAFPAAPQSQDAAPIESIDLAFGSATTKRLATHVKDTGDVDLADARVVVSGGRGMGSAAQYELLQPLASKLGAALGASRAAVDAGYASPERQVGQTGRIVAPDLYLAFGISGAVQHLAGMKDSRKIIAVNKDPEAPIFQVADYGLVADLFEVLPTLERSL
jgi:electron transfer flavoprotein alpha subunit